MPVLQIGPFALQTTLLALILAVWVGLSVAAQAARYRGLDGDHLYNAGLLSLVAAGVVARLAHVALYADAYLSQPVEIILPNPRAFVPLPGAVAAVVSLAIYLRRHGLSVLAVADAGAPGALAALAIWTAGIGVAGELAGAAAALPWAVEVEGLRQHPVAVYEVVALLLALVFVWHLLRGAAVGVPAWLALFGYGLCRLALEPSRAESVLLPSGVRLAQVLGLLAALCALWALRRLSAMVPDGSTRSPGHEDQAV